MELCRAPFMWDPLRVRRTMGPYYVNLDAVVVDTTACEGCADGQIVAIAVVFDDHVDGRVLLPAGDAVGEFVGEHGVGADAAAGYCDGGDGDGGAGCQSQREEVVDVHGFC